MRITRLASSALIPIFLTAFVGSHDGQINVSCNTSPRQDLRLPLGRISLVTDQSTIPAGLAELKAITLTRDCLSTDRTRFVGFARIENKIGSEFVDVKWARLCGRKLRFRFLTPQHVRYEVIGEFLVQQLPGEGADWLRKPIFRGMVTKSRRHTVVAQGEIEFLGVPEID